MANKKPNPLLPKQPEATSETVEEMGQMAVQKTVDVEEEQTPAKIKKETSNPIVKTLIIIGVIVIIIGLVTAFSTNVAFGIFLMILGSGGIIACIYMPIGTEYK